MNKKQVRNMEFELTEEKLLITTGILSLKEEEIKLYRILI